MARTIYYIALEGSSIGLPSRNPEGMHRIADGSKLDRREHPEVARVVESYFEQRRFIEVGYGKSMLKLIKCWNRLVFKLADFDPSFITWHKSITMPNPDYCENHVTLPDWRLDDDLILLLKAGTRKTFKLEPRGVDFD